LIHFYKRVKELNVIKSTERNCKSIETDFLKIKLTERVVLK